jgi:hypothetical protein
VVIEALPVLKAGLCDISDYDQDYRSGRIRDHKEHCLCRYVMQSIANWTERCGLNFTLC